MTALATAHRYMELFFSGSRDDLGRLRSILSPDLVFEGPIVQFRTATDYVDALMADPPAGMTFEIIASVESARAACLIYELHKPRITTRVAQYFELQDGLIAKIILVFDPSVVAD